MFSPVPRAETEVGVEATGSWYWLVDEIEAAGLVPHLAQPFAAKPMVGVGGKQTDSVDARSNFLSFVGLLCRLPILRRPAERLIPSDMSVGCTNGCAPARDIRRRLWQSHVIWLNRPGRLLQNNTITASRSRRWPRCPSEALGDTLVFRSTFPPCFLFLSSCFLAV